MKRKVFTLTIITIMVLTSISFGQGFSDVTQGKWF